MYFENPGILKIPLKIRVQNIHSVDFFTGTNRPTNLAKTYVLQELEFNPFSKKLYV